MELLELGELPGNASMRSARRSVSALSSAILSSQSIDCRTSRFEGFSARRDGPSLFCQGGFEFEAQDTAAAAAERPRKVVNRLLVLRHVELPDTGEN